MSKTGTTSTGFEYEITDEAMNDAELLDALIEADDGDATSMVRAIGKLLGPEQKKKLYEHVRNETGRVPLVGARSVASEITEIMSGDAAKNS